MAVLALGAIGAGIGAMTIGSASVGWVAGVMLGNALFAPDVEGPRLGDLRVTGTEYGQPIPWVAGSPRIAGQIVWASNKRETANTQSAKGGPEQTTYTYDCDLLILLTENEITGVSRIWSNGELVYGSGTVVGEGGVVKGGVWSGIRIYTGTDDQLPDPTYEAAVGVGNAPAYRGRGYVVITGLQLGGGGQIPNLTFEVGTTETATVQTWPVTFAGPYDIVRQMDESAPPNITSTYTDQAGIIWGGVRGFNITYSQDWLDAGGPSGVPHGATIFPVGLQVEIEHTVSVVPGRLTRVFFIFDDVIRDASGNPGTVTINGVSIGSSPPWTFIAAFHAFYEFTPDTDSIHVIFRVNDNSTTAQSAGFGVAQFHQEIFSGTNTENLAIAIVELTDRAGYSVGDIDVDFPEAELLRALTISNISSTRSTLDLLNSAYFLEASKSDKIYIRPRAVDPVATIPWADLGASEDPVSDAEPLALTIANDLEIPGQIALSYPNMAGDYQVATEHSDRLLSGQESVQAMQMPLGMLPAEAKALADALLFDQVAGMTKTTVRLPLRYAYIEPGDVIEAVNFDGRSYRLRVQVKRDTLSIIELDCVLDDVGALDSAAVTDTGYISTTEPVRVAPTVFEALDIPLLRDADNSPGYYVAVGADRLSADDEWKGALVARSWDDTSYAELFRTTDEGVLAICSTTLGDWTGGNVWDESNTLTVVTSGGELASSTRSAMQADETLNVLAVGSQATGWELLRFRRAELTAPNTYVLSGFLRGFRGTEWRMGSHAAGEQAVLLDAALRRATSQTSQIGLARYIKAVTFGQILANVDSELFVDTGEALRPWAPAHPVALADDDGDLVLTWQRRTRLSHRYDGDSPAVPLGEAAELYRVRVYDGAILVRTATATEAAYLYTAAEQAADGFTPGDPVTFEICQVSETVGAGRPAICTGVAP